MLPVINANCHYHHVFPKTGSSAERHCSSFRSKERRVAVEKTLRLRGRRGEPASALVGVKALDGVAEGRARHGGGMFAEEGAETVGIALPAFS